MKLFYEVLYARFRAPWDIGPRQELVELVGSGRLTPCRTIDLGSGTASNCVFLAQHGFDVTGVDFAQAAVDLGNKRAAAANVQVNFIRDDLTNLQNVRGAFDLLVDYGTLDDAELAAIVLIFTSQAWNMTFSFYQSMTTIPRELHEAAAIYRFSSWLRFSTLELPFAAIGLLWNSMMSWSGGWFFLMAAEIFHVGARDFRLPGLGSYLQTAANEANLRAIVMGIASLVLVIVLPDQFVWRPLIAWTDKYKVEMAESGEPPASWFFDMLSRSWLVEQFRSRVGQPFSKWIDRGLRNRLSEKVVAPKVVPRSERSSWTQIVFAAVFAVAMLYGAYRNVGNYKQPPNGTL